jgi:hypothetical protein
MVVLARLFARSRRCSCFPFGFLVVSLASCSSSCARASAWASSFSRCALERFPATCFLRRSVLLWSSILASFGLLVGQERDNRAARGERGRMLRKCEGRTSRAPGQDVASSRRQDVTRVGAGRHPTLRQDVAVRLCAHKNTVSLLSLTLPGCHRAAFSRLAERRCKNGSGRRGSNQESSLLGRQIVTITSLARYRSAAHADP